MVVLDVRWKASISRKREAKELTVQHFSSMAYIEAGEVVCLGTGFFQWTIDDFLSKVKARFCIVQSPWINYLDSDCYIDIYIKKSENELGLSFFIEDKLFFPRLHVGLGMNTGFKGTRKNRSGETNDLGSYEVAVWMPYSEFVERISEILNDGKLTVFCDLRTLDTDESPAALQEKLPREEKVQEKAICQDQWTVSECQILKKLQIDLKNILDSGEECDVTIKVRGKQFLAHSFFLQARSPVFKSMFSREMVEKLSGVVVIDDCDPETFPDLLNYLYTGSTKHISDENVCQLYTSSDKYQVEELKQECAMYMKNNLSVGNFYDIIALALRHSDKELVGKSTDFFCANVTKIAKTAAWQTFLHENTTAGNELFLQFLSRKRYK